jgi:hypothetical protein
MSNRYLPLTEYSSKHKVSISTLRRRIKANDIQYRFDQGKYLILDDGFQEAQRPSLKDASHEPTKSFVPASLATQQMQSPSLSANPLKKELPNLMKSDQDFLTASSAKNDEPILTAANRLLTELKKAYTQILQEKEEQILHLKEEVTDLKTLVRVLEAENERLADGPVVYQHEQEYESL